MQERQLPEGFKYADQIPDDGKKWEHDPPEAYEKPKQRQPELSTVHTLRGALNLFMNQIPSRKIQDVKLEGARVGAVFVREPTNEKYLVLYKREKYLHFSRHFPDIPSELKGYGIIANLKLVHWAALEGINIATVFPEGDCFGIEAMEFYKFYEQYDTEVSFLPGEIASSMKMWKRLF